MNLQELHSFFKEQNPTIYRVEDGKVIEYKTLVYKKGKKEVADVSDIGDDNTFSVGFSKPSNWKPDYALPFVSVMSMDEKTGRIMVEKSERKGGWDVPGRFFWEDGDFFLTEDDAKRFINGQS